MLIQYTAESEKMLKWNENRSEIVKNTGSKLHTTHEQLQPHNILIVTFSQHSQGRSSSVMDV